MFEQIAAATRFDMSDDSFLTAKQVMTRYGGIAEMTLWRWVNHYDNGFPKPIYVNRRRLWSLSAIEAWERLQARQRAGSSQLSAGSRPDLVPAGA